MIYTPMTKLALNLCFTLHEYQKDKGNSPYVFHPFHLAEQMTDEDSCIVALLHDIIEDTPCTLDDLKKLGFSTKIIRAIDDITYKEGMDYFDYINIIHNNPLATRVKLADLKHNMDVTRLEEVTKKDEQRIKKYNQAIQLLSS